MRHIPEFDGLRGMLSMFVVIAHLQSSWLFWVWGSMDIFFCLSGFLIGTLLLRNQSKSGFLLEYARRRILRIWPSYYAMLLLTLLLLFAVQHLGDASYAWSPGGATVQYFFFLQHVEMWFSTGPSAGVARGYTEMLGHAWSVALEEQFYLLVPLITFLLARGRLSVFAFAALFTIAAVGGIFIRSAYDANWVTLPGRFDGFAAGLLLAALIYKSKGQVTPVVRRLAWVAVIASVGVIGFLYVRHAGNAYSGVTAPLFTVGVTAFSVLGMGALALIYAHSGKAILLPLHHKLPVFLGQMSYSTYLWHVPVIWFVGPVLVKQGLLSPAQQFWLLISLCFLVAYVAHIFIERPLLKYRQQRKDSTIESRQGAGSLT